MIDVIRERGIKIEERTAELLKESIDVLAGKAEPSESQEYDICGVKSAGDFIEIGFKRRQVLGRDG